MKSPLSIKVMLSWRTRGGSAAADGQLRPPLVTVSLPGSLFLWLHPSTEEGWRGHSSPFSPLLWKIVQLSDHGSISVSTLCWIIARFLLVLCYVCCLVAGVWSWTESLGVTFVFSFIETVLQLLLDFTFFKSHLFLSWLDVGHMACFIGHRCSETRTKESPVQLDDNKVLVLEVMLHIYLLMLHQHPPIANLSCAPKDLSSTSLLQILACLSHIIWTLHMKPPFLLKTIALPLSELHQCGFPFFPLLQWALLRQPSWKNDTLRIAVKWWSAGPI